MKPAFVLALAVHLALVAFLWVGVSWQADTGDMVEAEVWDIKVREAAPLAAGERSELAAAEPVPEQAAVNEPAPPPPAQRHQAEPEPVRDTPPDIALEQERKKQNKRNLPNRNRLNSSGSRKNRHVARKKRMMPKRNRKPMRRPPNVHVPCLIRKHAGLPEAAAAAARARVPVEAERPRMVRRAAVVPVRHRIQPAQARQTVVISRKWRRKSSRIHRLMCRLRWKAIRRSFMTSNCYRTELCVIYANGNRRVLQGLMKRC